PTPLCEIGVSPSSFLAFKSAPRSTNHYANYHLTQNDDTCNGVGHDSINDTISDPRSAIS
ncbi:MAG: hypothetical protein NZM06_04890, partial [Chloroherpetonaceae bacterium]|nr:hypothetical protein [Chloroherpetonaceae bacterium]